MSSSRKAKRWTGVWVAFLASFASGLQSFGQDHPAVDAVFAEWDKPGSPGVALAVTRDGNLVYQRGYGQANLDYGLPLSGESVFYLASVSKQFTAAAIALLVVDGQLNLDDDVRRYVPELHDFGHTITVGHLVHHTSGLPDYLTLMSLAGKRFGDEHKRDEILDLICKCDVLNFKPGDEYLYSNTGYFLLAVIVERVSGKSLREFSQDRIFDPLKMTSTHFHDDHREIVKQRVISYARPANDEEVNIAYLANFDQVGSGGLLSCARDLVRWDANFESLAVGGTAWKQLMLTQGVLNNGERLAYSFGLVHEGYKGLRTVGHGGSMMGFRTQFLRFPRERLSVIVLANLASINPRSLALRVADLFLEEEIAASLATYCGNYRHEALGIEYTVTQVSGDLMLVGEAGTEPRRMQSLSELDVFQADSGPKVTFTRIDGGRATACTIDAGRARNIKLVRRE